MWVRSLGWEDPLEEDIATHYSILAWKSPWTEEPVRLQSVGLQRVGHDKTAYIYIYIHTHTHTHSSRGDLEITQVPNTDSFLKKTPHSGYDVHAKWLQLSPTLCDPMDCSPPGSSIHGILQARILEWVAMPFSRGLSKPRDRTCISVSCTGWRPALDH